MTATLPEVARRSFEERRNEREPCERKFGSTPRTAALRAALKWKAAVVKDFVEVIMGLAKCEFRQGESIRVDVDRARFITESFKQTDGQPWAIRQAKAFAHLCEKLPLFIKAGELIVGDPNSATDELRWHPEISADFMVDAVSTGSFSEMVTDAEREEIVSEICAVLARPERCGPYQGSPARRTVPGRSRRPRHPDRGEVMGDGNREPHL